MSGSSTKDPVGERLGPITPGLKSFGFGPQGQSTLREPLPVETETTAPLPPPRPDSLPKAVPMLKNLKEIYSFSGEVDLGGAGLTIAESLAKGLKSGTGSVSDAAGGMNDAVRNAVGADLTSAGQHAAESYAAGLRKGVPAVAAAAQALGAAAVSSANRNAMARGGSKTISGALHDGVE